MATIEPYDTQSGRRYMIRYRTPDRRSTKKRGFKTKAAAKDFAATIEVEKMTGAYIAPAAGRITVDDLAVQWKASLVDISESWYERQESIWRIHVQPHWGHWQISKISHGDVQSWVAGLSAADRLPNPLAPRLCDITSGSSRPSSTWRYLTNDLSPTRPEARYEFPGHSPSIKLLSLLINCEPYPTKHPPNTKPSCGC